MDLIHMRLRLPTYISGRSQKTKKGSCTSDFITMITYREKNRVKVSRGKLLVGGKFSHQCLKLVTFP